MMLLPILDILLLGEIMIILPLWESILLKLLAIEVNLSALNELIHLKIISRDVKDLSPVHLGDLICSWVKEYALAIGLEEIIFCELEFVSFISIVLSIVDCWIFVEIIELIIFDHRLWMLQKSLLI